MDPRTKNWSVRTREVLLANKTVKWGLEVATQIARDKCEGWGHQKRGGKEQAPTPKTEGQLEKVCLLIYCATAWGLSLSLLPAYCGECE